MVMLTGKTMPNSDLIIMVIITVIMIMMMKQLFVLVLKWEHG